MPKNATKIQQKLNYKDIFMLQCNSGKEIDMKQLKLSVWIMAIIGVFLIAASLISSRGVWGDYYKSWIFIIITVIFTAVLICGLFCVRFSVKKLGFYLCHIGVAVIVVCSFVSWKYMKETSFAIPVNPYAFYGEVMQDDGSELKFGFDISVASFEVEKYEAEYRLYDNTGVFSEENILIETVPQNRKGFYDMGKYGKVSVDELKSNNEYTDFYELENGFCLVKLSQADKAYKALMQIRDTDGNVHKADLEINKPYIYNGWKFYLMGYDAESMQYVNMYVKNDPANIAFAIGIWITVIGTFMECFSLIKRKEAQE